MFEASHLQYSIVSGYIQIVSDGHQLPAFWAHPELGGPFPGLVMLHDHWGVTAHLRTQARRFAEQGYYVIVPDLFKRQIATTPEQARTLIDQLGEAALAHVRAAIHALLTHHKCNSKIGLVGWGMGGKLALQTATYRDDLSGVVTFSSLPEGVSAAELRMLDEAVLAIFGEKDAACPPERVEQMQRILSGSKLPHEVVIYPGADRDFFDDSRPAFNLDAAENAWKRALAFLDDHLDVPPRPPTEKRVV
jgi:carboxymethylenebutenolidase